MAKDVAVNKNAPTKYSKEQFIRSSCYMKRRDLLGALLLDDKQYTFEEVDTAINNYMKGKVN